MKIFATTILFIVESENMFTVRLGTNPHRRWRGLYPVPCVGV